MTLYLRVFLVAVQLLSALESCCCNSNVKVDKGIALTGDTVGVETIGTIINGDIVVKGNIDLQGNICCLPANALLDLRHGTITNGCLIGNHTRLLCKRGAFNHVKIKGTWISPVIKSDYFSDLTYENALQDVIALTNTEIKNLVYVSSGDYYVSIDKNGGSGMVVESNTTLKLDGTIHLIPNKYRISYIVYVKGNNINIKGNGTIIGDKTTHLGESGEWGMGIALDNAINVRISGLTIKNCWGDCIYVGGESKCVKIDKCILDNGRRQGISITSGNDIVIKRTKILNVNGTAPQYAIDVEPNRGDMCDNIFVDHVEIENCKGGIQVFGRAERACVGKIIIKHCKMEKMVFVPLRVEKCESLELKNNEIANFKTNEYKLFKDVGLVKENGSVINGYKQKK